MSQTQNDDLTIKLKADDGQFLDVTARAAQGLDKVGASATTMARGLSQVAENSKITRAQMLSLNYTLSDTVASLASGASPLTILLQQGPQVRDAFGGIGNAFRGVLSLLSPLKVGLGAAALAASGAAVAAYQGADEMQGFQRMLTLTGNASGLTADQLNNLAERISSTTRQTLGESRSIVKALAESGQVSSRVMDSAARAVGLLADATGGDAKKIAADFATMTSGVAKWAAEHNKAWNFISVEQFKYIQRLEEQGKAEQAAVYVNDQLIKRLSGQAEQLGYIDRALDLAAKGWSRFWNAAMNLGRPDTVQDRLGAAKQQLEGLQSQLDRNLAIGRGDATIPGLGSLNDGLRSQIKGQQATVISLMRAMDEANVAAFSTSETAAKNRAGIAGLMNPDRSPKKPDFMGVPDEEIRRELRDRARMELDSVMELFRNDIAASDARKREEADRQRRLTQASEFAQQLVSNTEGIYASMLPAAEARGQALIAIEKAQLTSRLAQFELDGEKRKLIEDEISAYIVARQAQLTEELKPEWQRQLEAWRDTQELMRASHATIMQGIVQQGEDAFVNWLKTGKLNTKQLVAFIGDEFAKLTYRKFLAESVSQGGNFLLNLVGLVGGAVSGGSAAGAAGTDYSLATQGVKFGGMKAAGGPVAASTAYVVGERGPELLVMGNRSGSIIPNGGGSSPSASAPPVMNITYNVPPGQSPASYAAALEANNRQLEARFTADMVRPGRALQRAAARGSRI